MASIPGSSVQTVPSSQEANGQSYRGPFAIMTVLFFMWGFMTVFNDILIPRFKEAFTLNYYQAMLVQFAFFGAYFVGSLLYYLISTVTGDPIARIGYKNGVIIGLLLSAAGSALFWPAAVSISYPLFLFALFVVGLGFAMLQIACNPYVTILGPEKTASSRLNLASISPRPSIPSAPPPARSSAAISFSNTSPRPAPTAPIPSRSPTWPSASSSSSWPGSLP
jgi:FHS family L-fucose permease-like MFS transporter